MMQDTEHNREKALAGLNAYARFWGTIRREDIEHARSLIADDMVFIDPFSEIHGADGIIRMLHHMFEQCHDPRFVMRQLGLDVGGPDADGCYNGYILWDFAFEMKPGGKTTEITGMSAIRITGDGLIAAHVDHWDSGQQLLRNIPVLGFLVNQVLRMLAAEPQFRRP